jgi:hypothetical protein
MGAMGLAAVETGEWRLESEDTGVREFPEFFIIFFLQFSKNKSSNLPKLYKYRRVRREQGSNVVSFGYKFGQTSCHMVFGA